MSADKEEASWGAYMVLKRVRATMLLRTSETALTSLFPSALVASSEFSLLSSLSEKSAGCCDGRRSSDAVAATPRALCNKRRSELNSAAASCWACWIAVFKFGTNPSGDAVVTCEDVPLPFDTVHIVIFPRRLGWSDFRVGSPIGSDGLGVELPPPSSSSSEGTASIV